MRGSAGRGRLAAAFAGRAARTIVIALVFAFVVSWALEKVPALGLVLAVLGIGLLVWSLWNSLRAPQKLVALGAMAFSLVFGAGIAFAVDSLRGDPEPEVAADVATAASTRPTDSSPVETFVTVPSTPAVSVGEVSEPTSVPPTSVATLPDASTVPTTTPTAVRVPVVDDAADDVDTDDAVGMTITGDVASIFFAQPLEGDVWLWSLSDPAKPLVLEATAAVANGQGVVLDIELRTAGDGQGPWAASTGSGDRIPDVGFVDADNTHITVGAQGAGAADVESSLAAIQAAVPSLDPLLAELVVNVMARQVALGSFTLELRAEGVATGASFGFHADYPAFVQVVDDEAGSDSLWMTADGGVACDRAAICSAQPIEGLPLNAALAVIDDPAAMRVVAVDIAGFDGAARCVGVLSTVDGGPSVGTSCWDDAGGLVVLDLPETGNRFVRTDVTNTRSDLFDATPEVG